MTDFDPFTSTENLWVSLVRCLGFSDDLPPLSDGETIGGFLCSKPDIPVEIEPYFKFFVTAVELAKSDIENAEIGGQDFNSAVDWLIYGEGYDYLTLFLNDPERVRKFFESIVDRRRRGAVGSESGHDRLAVVQRPGVRRQSATVRSRIKRYDGVSSTVK